MSLLPRLPATRFNTSNARITTWFESASSTKSCLWPGVSELSMGIRSEAEAGRKVNFKNASIYWLSFLIAVAMGTGNSWDDCLKADLLKSWFAAKNWFTQKIRMWAAAFRLSGKSNGFIHRKGRKGRKVWN